MLTLKYSKTDEARFISHIDLLRHVSRIARRGGIPIKRSQGFNPHALVFFSPPTVLGLSSYAEYISIDTDIAKSQLLDRYNSHAPHGIVAENAYLCAKNPNLQAIVVAADYVFDVPYGAVKEAFDSPQVAISYEKKGQQVVEDVKDKIYAVYSHDGKLALRLASGGVNLRPDRLLSYVNAATDSDLKVTDITKIAQFVRSKSGDFVSVDDYLAALERGVEGQI